MTLVEKVPAVIVAGSRTAGVVLEDQVGVLVRLGLGSDRAPDRRVGTVVEIAEQPRRAGGILEQSAALRDRTQLVPGRDARLGRAGARVCGRHARSDAARRASLLRGCRHGYRRERHYDPRSRPDCPWNDGHHCAPPPEKAPDASARIGARSHRGAAVMPVRRARNRRSNAARSRRSPCYGVTFVTSQLRISWFIWRHRPDSNRRMRDLQSRALPTWRRCRASRDPQVSRTSTGVKVPAGWRGNARSGPSRPPRTRSTTTWTARSCPGRRSAITARRSAVTPERCSTISGVRRRPQFFVGNGQPANSSPAIAAAARMRMIVAAGRQLCGAGGLRLGTASPRESRRRTRRSWRFL